MQLVIFAVLVKIFCFRNEKAAQRGSFRAGHPVDIGGHSRGYAGSKLRSRALEILENKHFSADIHDPKARTSTTLRDFQKLRAEFSFPTVCGKTTVLQNHRFNNPDFFIRQAQRSRSGSSAERCWHKLQHWKSGSKPWSAVWGDLGSIDKAPHNSVVGQSQ